MDVVAGQPIQHRYEHPIQARTVQARHDGYIVAKNVLVQSLPSLRLDLGAQSLQSLLNRLVELDVGATLVRTLPLSQDTSCVG